MMKTRLDIILFRWKNYDKMQGRIFVMLVAVVINLEVELIVAELDGKI